MLKNIHTDDTIVVSACFIGINCKYNGKNNASPALINWLKDTHCIALCPKALGGLATPRPPAEIVNGVLCTQDGKSVHEAFLKGSKVVLEKVITEEPKLVILQSSMA